jgi:hypothetical protein
VIIVVAVDKAPSFPSLPINYLIASRDLKGSVPLVLWNYRFSPSSESQHSGFLGTLHMF